MKKFESTQFVVPVMKTSMIDIMHMKEKTYVFRNISNFISSYIVLKVMNKNLSISFFPRTPGIYILRIINNKKNTKNVNSTGFTKQQNLPKISVWGEGNKGPIRSLWSIRFQFESTDGPDWTVIAYNSISIPQIHP